MPGKYREVFDFNFNYSVWMSTFCHSVVAYMFSSTDSVVRLTA